MANSTSGKGYIHEAVDAYPQGGVPGAVEVHQLGVFPNRGLARLSRALLSKPRLTAPPEREFHVKGEREVARGVPLRRWRDWMAKERESISGRLRMEKLCRLAPGYFSDKARRRRKPLGSIGKEVNKGRRGEKYEGATPSSSRR